MTARQSEGETDTQEPGALPAGLTLVVDSQPGIRRRRTGGRFKYVGTDGAPIRSDRTLNRIRRLVIPPAWQDVWISPREGGHIQATGRDARGRKQYKYHSLWQQTRDGSKYQRTIEFGRALPGLRRQVQRDLGKPGLSRRKVTAAVVHLLELSLVRVGNSEYQRANRTFGLTTLRDRHVQLQGSCVSFQFLGKGSKEHSVDVRNRRLANVVRRCRDLPGYQLFQYLDNDGVRRRVTSADVNRYLAEVTGGPYTAKDFRTWAGTVLVTATLRDLGPPASERQAKANISAAVRLAASKLGNTLAVCRKCYVHPGVIDIYTDGGFPARRGRLPEGLSEDEAFVLNVLRHWNTDRADSQTS